MNLCLIDLAQLTGGRLYLADMPPLDGVLSRVGRIVLSAASIGPGDVFWPLSAGPGDIEMAFFRGAFGVVHSGRRVEPWPGRFCLQVDDPLAAFRRLISSLECFEEQFSPSRSELKVLQLSAAHPSCIPPPTCGRSADEPPLSRCRRQAA